MYATTGIYRSAAEINTAMGRVFGHMGLAVVTSMIVSMLVAGSPGLMAFLFGTAFKWIVIFAPLVAILALSFGLEKLTKTQATVAVVPRLHLGCQSRRQNQMGHHVGACAAQCGQRADRASHGAICNCHLGRSGFVLFGIGHATAQPQLGSHAERGAIANVPSAHAGGVSRRGHCLGRTGPQFDGRRFA